MDTTNRSVAVLPGDGIGPEVTDEALRTLDALRLGLSFDVLEHVNASAFLRDGVALSDPDVERMAAAGAILLGAVGDPRVTTPDYARGVLLRLRSELDLYVNHRPATLLVPRLSPLRNNENHRIDCVIVRENTEGLYAGIGGAIRAGTPHELAIDAEISTHHGVSRVVDYAYGIARRGVCMVDKANAVPFGGRVWQRCWRAASARNRGVTSTHLHADVAAMRLVLNPEEFDVIVTNNSYGDILSDIAAAVAGGLGIAASANLNPETGTGLYEPVHGSAPDIAGTGTANPVGAILSAALLLERRGNRAEAGAVRAAVRAVIAAGRCTPDLGGDLGTKDAGAAIRAEL